MCGMRATLTHKQMEVTCKGKMRFRKYIKDKGRGGERNEEKGVDKTGNLGKCNNVNCSEMFLYSSTVIQMSRLLLSHCCVYMNVPGCQIAVAS